MAIRTLLFPCITSYVDTHASVERVVTNRFVPRRLMIPSDVAGKLGIIDILINGKSQFVKYSKNPDEQIVSYVSCKNYSENCIQLEQDYDHVEAGEKIEIIFINLYAQAVLIQVSFIGESEDVLRDSITHQQTTFSDTHPKP